MKPNLENRNKGAQFLEFRRKKTTYTYSKVVFPRMDALSSNISRETALAIVQVDSTEVS